MKTTAFIILSLTLLVSCDRQNEKDQADHISSNDSVAVVQEGKAITQDAFQVLSSKLGQAVQEGGIGYALEFCNVEALPITDSLSANYNVELRRASHRPRNPANRADSLEMETIRDYLSKLENQDPGQAEDQKELEPRVYKESEHIIYHAPIMINNGLCLNCHGREGAQIQKKNLELIRQLYPDDEATGFEIGELRGIWSVEFPDAYFEQNEIESKGSSDVIDH